MISNSNQSNLSVSVTITCSQHSSLSFTTADDILITDLEFAKCSHKVKSVSRYTVEGCKFLNSTGTAVHVFNSTAYIIRSSFISNSVGSMHNSLRVYYFFFSSPSVGAAITARFSNTTVVQSIFERNNAEIGGAIFIELHSTMNISSSTFVKNFVAGLESSGGVLYADSGCAVMIANSEFNNNWADNQTSIGGVLAVTKTNLSIKESIFELNRGSIGGVVFAYNHDPDMESFIKISDSNFTSNSASFIGGVLCTENVLFITVSDSNFNNNRAKSIGGVMHISGDYYSGGYITISDTHFINNIANNGGAVFMILADIIFSRTKFVWNSAENGGAVSLSDVNVTFSACELIFNTASNEGGAINAKVLQANITNSNFNYNTAKSGGALHVTLRSYIHFRNVVVNNNTANQGIMFFIECIIVFVENNIISDNVGSLFLYYSSVTFEDKTKFINCLSNEGESSGFQEGGAITAFQSDVIFKGTSTLLYNGANNGGAIQASFSKLNVYGSLLLSNNTARITGGGIYLYQSDLNCHKDSTFRLIGNSAVEKGGGIHAIASVITAKYDFHVFEKFYTGSSIHFLENWAGKVGGGVCLEVNAKLNVLNLNKYNSEKPGYALTFAANLADLGGAIYVGDDTNSGTCASDSYKRYSPATECFLQTLVLRRSRSFKTNFTNLVNVEFANNLARVHGSNVFGGLLDRCTFSPFSKKNDSLPEVFDGITYLAFFTTINNFDQRFVSSYPVRVCFCNVSKPSNNIQPDCSYQPEIIRIRKGEKFTLPLAAVDQASHTISANIYIFLQSNESGIGEGQLVQSTGGSCTNLNFNVFSPHEYEELIMYADGPCKDATLSQGRVKIEFIPCNCPVGFQEKGTRKTSCECVCDTKLGNAKRITFCDPQMETLTREGKFWITNVSIINTDNESYVVDYLIYPYCPLDYCKPSSSVVKINLNIPNGADAQCANNRSGLLCGTCKLNFSLSLGSSHCIKCPNYWPVVSVVILIVAVLAGIALVALILVLNLTVAVGTLNGIIFYANVVAANGNTFIPFRRPGFLSVFVAWLNLDIGINVCFIKSMDAYWKTWLQLAFPSYVIFLVFMVIFISARFKTVSDLIGKKNPVATLATLILLSYAKLLHTVITILSCAILKYPASNGPQQKSVWLPDATVEYLKGKHVILFIVAIIILLAGVTYTVLLFSWQWLLHIHGNRFINKLTRNQKLSLFIVTYHAPYTPQSRYWTGLMLLARVILYVISAVNVSGDPKINLLTTGTIVIGIFMLNKIMSMGKSKGVYKKVPIEILEVVSYLNLIILCLATFFALDDDKAKVAIANISVSIMFILLLGILSYHTFTEIIASLKTKFWKRKEETTSDSLQSITEMPSKDNELTKTLAPTSTIVDTPKRSSSVHVQVGDTLCTNFLSPYSCELREALLEHSD